MGKKTNRQKSTRKAIWVAILTILIFSIIGMMIVAGIIMAIVGEMNSTLMTAGMIMAIVGGVALLIMIITYVTGETPWW